MTYDARQITTPDYEYAGDYYPQLVSRIRRLNRSRVPEITNEDDRELFIQLERAFALAMHNDTVLLDLVANSMFLPTSKIPESVKVILQLIGSDLLPANPAQVDILATLASRYAAPTRVLEPFRKFATKRTPDYPEIIFENYSAIDLSARTDEFALTYGYGLIWLSQSSGPTAELSSLEPDQVYDSTASWTSANVGDYMVIHGSSIGNDLDHRRILEVIDANTVRLENASFISEDAVEWTIYRLSSNCASDWNAGIANDPFGGTMHTGDIIYIGHPDILWDRVDAAFTHPTITPGYKTLWEFYDPREYSTHPDLVVVNATMIEFTLTTLLGPDDASGALIEIEYIPTGAKYRKFSSFSGGLNIVDIDGYLGQSDPSISTSDYIVRCPWRALPDLEDLTITSDSSWSKDGKFEYSVPRTMDDSWYRYRLYDKSIPIETMAFYLRLRIVSNVVGSDPIIPNRVRIDRNNEYVLARLVQGQTIEVTNLSSNGQANQIYPLQRKPYVWLSARVFVTEGSTEYEWITGTSFVRSRSTSRHCVVDPQTDGTALLKFGDGTAGKIPPIGTNNIRVVYRIKADDDGNIGANTLTVNRDGAGAFSQITNPRPGFSWLPSEWSSQLELETAKARAPRVFQTMKRAVSPGDAASLATAFRNISGSRTVKRAKAYEESFGPKTIEVVVVGGGGAALDDADREELTEYFNGGGVYGYNGINLYNSRVVVTNYIPKMISLTIRIESYPIITETIVRRLLAEILSPTAIERNGIGFMWRFGQTVALSKVASEIVALSPGNIFNVDIAGSDINLINRELPLYNAIGTNITIIDPRFEE